jgi:hypothetical protein
MLLITQTRNIKGEFAVNSHVKGLETKIKRLYTSTALARSFFKWAASRVNDRTETTLDRLEVVLQTGRRDVVALARSLDEIGCGKFIEGRRGAHSRIQWHYSLRSLGLVAIGTKDAVEDVDAELAADESNRAGGEESGTAPEAGGEGIRHQFTLRPDVRVEFLLPKDLTSREAERLASFIHSLPFEGPSPKDVDNPSASPQP